MNILQCNFHILLENQYLLTRAFLIILVCFNLCDMFRGTKLLWLNANIVGTTLYFDRKNIFVSIFLNVQRTLGLVLILDLRFLDHQLCPNGVLTALASRFSHNGQNYGFVRFGIFSSAAFSVPLCTIGLRYSFYLKHYCSLCKVDLSI